ncbi:hypothetical protein EYR36_007137 [Pleurotus pulmonarius]|nr:hypothetical protein EYR36_007137 [Pleurotus pulmonarius]
MSSQQSPNYEAFNGHEYSKHSGFDFISFTSPSDIVAPSPDLFETELDSNLEGLDDSQIPFFTVNSSDAFSILRSENPTCGPPSTITVSSESAYDSPHSTYSDPYYNNYAGSNYCGSTYSIADFNEVDMQRINLNAFDFAPSPATVDPTSFGTLPLTPPTSPPAPGRVTKTSYEKYIPRSFSDYTPSTREAADFYPSPYRTQSTVSPTHISAQLPTLPDKAEEVGKGDDPRRKYKCNVCSRAFARAFNLKTHMSTHDPNRSKPYTCSHRSCGRSFSRKHDLGRHLISIHRDASVLPSHPSATKKSVGVTRTARAWCETCGKSYFDKEASCGCHSGK